METGKIYELHVYAMDWGLETVIATEWEITPLRVLIIQNKGHVVAIYNADSWNKVVVGKEVDANS